MNWHLKITCRYLKLINLSIYNQKKKKRHEPLSRKHVLIRRFRRFLTLFGKPISEYQQLDKQKRKQTSKLREKERNPKNNGYKIKNVGVYKLVLGFIMWVSSKTRELDLGGVR